MKAYYKKNTGKIGVPKWGKLDAKTKKKTGLALDYFVHHETKINYPDIDEEGNETPSGKSMISFRFHSEGEFCKMNKEWHVKQHGGIHVRYFVYDGIDKTEAELLDWVLNTPNLVANDGKTEIKGAKQWTE